MNKEILIEQLKKENNFRFRDGWEKDPFRSDNYILTEIIEKAFVTAKKTNETEKAGVLEEVLKGRYQQRGFNKEESDEFIKAILEGGSLKRKIILLGVAERFKEVNFLWAAEEYFEAEEYGRAFELLIQGGHEGTRDGKEFFWAADCLVKTGVETKEAHSRMAEEIRKMIKTKLPKWGKDSSHIRTAYSFLGECLDAAGKREEALRAFMRTEPDKSYKLSAGREYLAKIGEWERAAKFQEKYMDLFSYTDSGNCLRLAEYYHKAGLAKEEAKALWKGERFLEAARIFFGISNNREYFLEAGKMYRTIEPKRLKIYTNDIWGWFRNSCLLWSIKFEETENMGEKLNEFHNLIELLYSAYSLPAPTKINNLEITLNERKKLAEELFKKFRDEKKKTKKPQLRTLLANSTFVESIENAALAGLIYWGIHKFTREAFVGVPNQRPDETKLPREIRELWNKAVKWEIELLGYDPIEMSGRSFEEGGYFKEARERYLKANLLSDVARMDQLLSAK